MTPALSRDVPLSQHCSPLETHAYAFALTLDFANDVDPIVSLQSVLKRGKAKARRGCGYPRLLGGVRWLATCLANTDGLVVLGAPSVYRPARILFPETTFRSMASV